MYNQWDKPRQEVTTIKISPELMNERLQLCAKEQSIPRRIAMLEKLRTQVQRASVPFIDFQIRKTRSKL